MKSLFFVSSPLEMICAIEARSQFKTTNNILVLYLFDLDKKIIESINSLTDTWQQIHTLERSSINYGKKWIVLTNTLKKDKYQYLFTGGMTFSAHFLHNINYQKQYFLDDGTLTLTNVSYFKKHGNLTKKMSLFPGHNKTKIKHKLNEALHNLFGHKLRGKWEKLNLFTFFDFNKHQNIHVKKNKLLWFEKVKSEKELTVNNNLVYVIGTPLVFAKVVSEEYYHTLLHKIEVYFADKKIVYIPHRWERKEDVNKVKSVFNFDIKKNKTIIELDFLTQGVLPKHIAGTTSTALFTLKHLYPNATTYTTGIDLENVFNEKKDAFKAILEYQKGLFKEI